MALRPIGECALWMALGGSVACGAAAPEEPERAEGPEPARLRVEGPDDAVVHLDGEPVARLPLEEPLALEPGRRFVALTLDGTEPRAEHVELRRGAQTELSVDLELTAQRIAASTLLATGGAGLAAGIGLGVAAVVEQRRADDLLDGGATGEGSAYQDAVEARDDYRTGATAAGGAGLAVFLLGGALFVLDRAVPPEPPADDDRERRPEGPVDLTVAPALAPGVAGARVQGRF